ncbi:unnamed protein product [Rhodiola kirilowii]
MRPEELMRKIQEMEADHARLKREMEMLIIEEEGEEDASRFGIVEDKDWLMPPPLTRERWINQGGGSGSNGCKPQEVPTFTNEQYMNILESMGQSVHIMDCNYRITYWNKFAQRMYGHTREEAIGKNAVEFIVDVDEFVFARTIIDKVYTGESWTGQFPLINKKGEKFLVVGTNSPLYDDHGTLVGQISVTCDSQPFHDVLVVPSRAEQSEGEPGFGRFRGITACKPDLGPQQHLKVAITSKISNLASKVRNKVRPAMKNGNDSDQAGGAEGEINLNCNLLGKKLILNKVDGEISIPGGGTHPLPSGIYSQVETQDKPLGRFFRDATHEDAGTPLSPNDIATKAQTWMGKTGRLWSRREKEMSGSTNTHNLMWPWLHHNQSNGNSGQRSSESFGEQETVAEEKRVPIHIEVAAFDADSTFSPNTSRCTLTSSATKEILDTNSLDHDISWKDLVIGQQIGEGSCGTVYSAKWNESEVAVKAFTKLDYADDAVLSFRQEVSLMKKLRHPNVLLFMGAVTSGQHLCIVTEYLPRGSLFQLLQKSASKLDWKKRVSNALEFGHSKLVFSRLEC